MGFRFQKRITIIPGVRLNISKSGVSTSFGPKGASLNVGKNGVKGTVGIPGSGLSYSKQLVNKNGQVVGVNSQNRSQNQGMNLPVPAGLAKNDLNKIVFIDTTGNPYEPSIQKELKKVYYNDYVKYTEDTVREINALTNNLKNIDSFYRIADFFGNNYVARPFPEKAPSLQEILDSKPKGLFNFGRNEEAQREYEELTQDYNARKREWDTEEQKKESLSYNLQRLRKQSAEGNLMAMEQFLENLIQQVDFPHPIDDFSFEFEGSEGLWLDIDLPEIEMITDEVASINANGSLSVKKKTQRQLKEEYSMVVASVANILVTHIFTLFPTVNAIVISGRTQRVNKQGVMSDDYIYSLHVTREVAAQLNYFNNSPISLLAYYNPIMNLSKTNEWKVISPYFKG